MASKPTLKIIQTLQESVKRSHSCRRMVTFLIRTACQHTHSILSEAVLGPKKYTTVFNYPSYLPDRTPAPVSLFNRQTQEKNKKNPRRKEQELVILFICCKFACLKCKRFGHQQGENYRGICIDLKQQTHDYYTIITNRLIVFNIKANVYLAP